MSPRKSEIPAAVRKKVIKAYFKKKKNKAELTRLIGIRRTTISSMIKKNQSHQSVVYKYRSAWRPKISPTFEDNENIKRRTSDVNTTKISVAKEFTLYANTVRRKLFKMGIVVGYRKRRWKSD
jgi:hypothetical protein